MVPEPVESSPRSFTVDGSKNPPNRSEDPLVQISGGQTTIQLGHLEGEQPQGTYDRHAGLLTTYKSWDNPCQDYYIFSRGSS